MPHSFGMMAGFIATLGVATCVHAGRLHQAGLL